jgi:hypothetical protein
VLINVGVAEQTAVRVDAVLQRVEFPTGVAYLAAGLADMDGENFTLEEFQFVEVAAVFASIHLPF